MSRPDVKARLIGRERQPLVIVDNFTPDPDALRASAVARGFGPADHHYPGIRAPLPPDYLAAQNPVLATVLREVFGFRVSMRVIDSSYSIVTTPPHALTAEQRLPHVDAFAPGRIALLHYLAPTGGDGTAFYRHRSTGFETVDEARRETYFGRVDAELRRDGPPPASYIAGDTPLFQCTTTVEARYNRALIYRSSLLHSGAISPDAVLSSDPATGRLTITAFLDAA